jgi:apolipoprotein D and lipocalin family protein
MKKRTPARTDPRRTANGLGPSPKNASEREAQQAKRRDRDMSSWAKEIYAAPPGERDVSDDAAARVTVSTRMRKPKVYLTAPATAPRVDLARFMGRWYEIARLPYFTQRRCVKNVTADYVLGDDGMVYVTNRCAHKEGSGSAKAVARVTDRTTNARLEISFRTLYGVHVLWDDYWIIGVGDDYEYALVGQPTRRRAWVLARDPQPPEERIQVWIAEFAEKGFPAESFLRTSQDPIAEP